ncbi:hypothetical protein [Siphonobacter sp. SORGH_AS_0500]|uniref:hypothetical protein n=1 Tax=Siphonobacter sp. SORGH_AS_0500 TaxID=1864824 RepID=UPI0028659ECB|nr:hypothetical protein [Siphonobacter sp. SORGH_AS_0500]MDR6194913.1 hypothetical protein [Siphonobacter sp. SORGH_AS_0500]
MKNQLKVNGSSMPVSPVSGSFSASELRITQAVELSGHISLPAEFYEKYKDSEIFGKGIPRVEFHHQQRMIHLTAGEGEEAVWVVGHLTPHPIYADLKVFQREWMSSRKAQTYFEDHRWYFGPEHEGYGEVNDILNKKYLANIADFHDFKLHLPIFSELPVDMQNGHHVWLEMGTQADLDETPNVYFMSSLFSEMAQKVQDRVFAEQRERLKDLICIDIY